MTHERVPVGGGAQCPSISCCVYSLQPLRKMGRTTLGEVRSYIAVFLAFATAATLVYAATIALIILTKIKRHYTHRLQLYLAAAGLLHAIAIGLEVIPIDSDRPDNTTVSLRDNWGGVCVAIGFFAQYLTIFQTQVIVWISFYAFVLVALQRKLSQPKHEATFLLIVLLGSFLFAWEPFISHSYGQSGPSCWISDGVGRNSSLGPIFKLTVNVVPIFVMTFGGLVMLLVSSAILLRGSMKRDSPLRSKYRMALKELLPLLVYPTVYFVIIFVRIVVDFAYNFNDPTLNDVIFVSLLQTTSVALLLSVFMHGSVCRVICGERSRPAKRGRMLVVADMKPIADTSVYQPYQEPEVAGQAHFAKHIS